LTEFTSPYSLNTQRGWHTSKCMFQIDMLVGVGVPFYLRRSDIGSSTTKCV